MAAPWQGRRPVRARPGSGPKRRLQRLPLSQLGLGWRRSTEWVRGRLWASELEAEAWARDPGPLVRGHEVEARLLQVVLAQLAVAQASHWGLGAGAPLPTLLFPLGGPRGEHGGVYGKGGLAEILMLEAVLCVDPPSSEVGQKLFHEVEALVWKQSPEALAKVVIRVLGEGRLPDGGEVFVAGKIFSLRVPRSLNTLLIWSISDFPGNSGFWVSSYPKMQPTDHVPTAVEYSWGSGSTQGAGGSARPGRAKCFYFLKVIIILFFKETQKKSCWIDNISNILWTDSDGVSVLCKIIASSSSRYIQARHSMEPKISSNQKKHSIWSIVFWPLLNCFIQLLYKLALQNSPAADRGNQYTHNTHMYTDTY